MKTVFFVNDSYFAFLLAEPVLKRFHDVVSLIVMSTRNTGSPSRIRSICSKTSAQYFLYRSAVQCLSSFAGAFRGQSVVAAAKQYGIPLLRSSNFKADLPSIAASGPFDVGLAFNCDQVINQPLLDLCSRGVLNVHASKLPNDAGISPVLWAFARGDSTVWSTIYRMDEGIDTGPILQQIEMPVQPGDTAFSLYEKVCARSGAALADVLTPYLHGDLEARPQERNGSRTYWSWPDGQHQRMMRASGRRFMRPKDIVRTLSRNGRAT
jgi:folate-dependent phosphoribosylglycinamide formyltransferase PurN